jgi:hypothetical protein
VPLPHFVPNTGIRVQAGEIALAYTGDTGPDPQLAELGRDVDLFIVEATDRDGETRRPVRNLMTSAEAGRLARQAGARKLMITHFWPGNDRAAAAAAASAEFGRGALTAEEGLTVALGDLRIPAIEAGREAAMVLCPLPDRRPGKIAAWNVCLASAGTSYGPPTRRPWVRGIAIA